MKFRGCVVMLASLTLSSCVAYPALVPPIDDSCRLVTREFTLKAKEFAAVSDRCLQSLDSCLSEAALGAAIVAAAAVVSGSIVLVGNTIHWAERKGRCP